MCILLWVGMKFVSQPEKSDLVNLIVYKMIFIPFLKCIAKPCSYMGTDTAMVRANELAQTQVPDDLE